MQEKTITIGFANLTERQYFCRVVREGLETAVRLYPHVNIIYRDNDLDNDRAQANVDEFVSIPVDLAVIFHIDQRFNRDLNNIFMKHQIPVIAIDIPIPLTVYFGVNNRQAGMLAGAAIIEWVESEWDGKIDKILVATDARVLTFIRQRMDVAVEDITQRTGLDTEHVFYVDGANQREVSRERALPILERWSEFHRIVILGINDDTVLGVLDAARELGREQDVVGVGQGAILIHDAFSDPASRFIGSVAYFPNKYGAAIMDLALRILAGEKGPRENFVEHEYITPHNLYLLG